MVALPTRPTDSRMSTALVETHSGRIARGFSLEVEPLEHQRARGDFAGRRSVGEVALAVVEVFNPGPYATGCQSSFSSGSSSEIG